MVTVSINRMDWLYVCGSDGLSVCPSDPDTGDLERNNYSLYCRISDLSTVSTENNLYINLLASIVYTELLDTQILQ